MLSQAIRLPKVPALVSPRQCTGKIDNRSAEEGSAFLDHVPRFRRCALVSSSGSLLGSRCGKEIDHHDAVWRMNLPTTEGFEADVGWRTDVEVVMSWPARLLIDPSTAAYPELRAVIERVNDTAGASVLAVPHSHPPRPLRLRGATAILSGGSSKLCEPFLRTNLSRWGAKHLLYASTQFGAVFKTMARFMPADWVPSTGLRSIVLAWSLCDEITLYGFRTPKASSTRPGYHYWDPSPTSNAALDNSTDAQIRSKHQMEREHQLMQSLAMLDHLPICTSGPGLEKGPKVASKNDKKGAPKRARQDVQISNGSLTVISHLR
jgi:hypothetical protein